MDQYGVAKKHLAAAYWLKSYLLGHHFESFCDKHIHQCRCTEARYPNIVSIAASLQSNLTAIPSKDYKS